MRVQTFLSIHSIVKPNLHSTPNPCRVKSSMSGMIVLYPLTYCRFPLLSLNVSLSSFHLPPSSSSTTVFFSSTEGAPLAHEVRAYTLLRNVRFAIVGIVLIILGFLSYGNLPF